MMKIVTTIVFIWFSGVCAAQSEYHLALETLAELGVLKSNYRGVIHTYDGGKRGNQTDKKIGWMDDGKLDDVIFYTREGDEYIRYNWIYDVKGNILAAIRTRDGVSDTISYENLYDGDVLTRSEESVSSWISYDYSDGQLQKTTNYHPLACRAWRNTFGLSNVDIRREFDCGVTEMIYAYDSANVLVQVQSVTTDTTRAVKYQELTSYETKYTYENGELVQAVKTSGGMTTTKQFSREGRIRIKKEEVESPRVPFTYKYVYKKSKILQKSYIDGKHHKTDIWTLIDKTN